MEIRPLSTIAELDQCARVIRMSFATVATAFGYTPENAPTFPAFITTEKLVSEHEKGVRFFGMFSGSDQVGSVALERAPQVDNEFFLERLAVLPSARQQGLGRQLIDFAIKLVRQKGGRLVKIAIVDENRVLKAWYGAYGFRETGTKTYPHLPFTVCFLEKQVE
jgi:diamine N-acetyltransferase